MQLVLVFFVLLSHVTKVTAVAGCHSDRDKDHRPRENCTSAGFSDVPAGFELNTKVLLFPSNQFSGLSWSSFQIFREIYEIDLTGNKVPEVTSSVSPILPSLSVLRLGSNRLKALSDGSFSACPGLTELYLENNAIHSLSDHTFSGLSKLEILDLSSNHIKVLPELMLHPLPAIETLYLEYNKIKVMPDDWFSQKKEVPYLYLSSNDWVCTCSLGYLREYLDEYELNVYVRDGTIIRSDAESVVCDSPPSHKGKPVITLEESDLCPSGPIGDFEPMPITSTFYETTAAAAVPTIPATITSSPPPTTSTYPIPATEVASTIGSTAFERELYTEYYRVVTWSWYQTFTHLIEWSDHSGLHISATRPTFPTVKPSPESPAIMTTATPTKPVETTKSVPSTEAFATRKHRVTRTTTTTKATTGATAEATTGANAVATAGATAVTTAGATAVATAGATAEVTAGSTAEATAEATAGATAEATTQATTTSIPSRGKMIAVRGAGVFCCWLFAGCLLLCMASAACILATLARMVVWYRKVYKPLSLLLARRGGSHEGVKLLTSGGREEREVAGGGVMALYRSVLFIHREGDAMEREDGDEGHEEGGEGGKEKLLVTLEPTGGGATREEEGERGRREERGVYRKTLFRLLSKEEEIEGWKEVMEECRVSAEDAERRGGGRDEGMDRERSGGGGVSKKRYSVILREERGEARGGREELDWVVGGWEVKGGAGEGREEPRSSWGEWLAHYLPSMPWGVTTPPEDEAAQ
ncbi:platelet glycoprotein Ib alpha chain [Micropterus salmoides]|uniref:platelet glycoprotein Ib alpha chain n=1 Tax=Micropterus salmoides TaxID=27706 RepID=UPI0018EDA2D3|nr:platelet glycoprotein Ib alpha chain [Micropterus salmoides]